MTYYNIKCEQCTKKLYINTTFEGFAQYAAEAHAMETGHIVDVVDVN